MTARRITALEGKVSAGGAASAPVVLAALISPGNPGNGGGNGGGNGNRGGRQSPRPTPPPRAHGANSKGNFDMTPPVVPDDFATKLKNIEDARHDRAPEPTEPQPISANLRQCEPDDPSYPDCDGTVDEQTSDPDYATPRTLPQNETGGAGVDLGSRNFNWSTPLLNLPGRAGLDVNLSLVYNSLVWTKQDVHPAQCRPGLPRRPLPPRLPDDPAAIFELRSRRLRLSDDHAVGRESRDALRRDERDDRRLRIGGQLLHADACLHERVGAGADDGRHEVHLRAFGQRREA
ncbi:MAG: hypothetical protein H0U81_09520, partial [Pyrinomonadaceae bacterium]|nr:hypothetical protein [Pyrinomonadaceae bacterium]